MLKFCLKKFFFIMFTCYFYLQIHCLKVTEVMELWNLGKFRRFRRFRKFRKLRKFGQVSEVTEVWARVSEFDQKGEMFRQSQNNFARNIILHQTIPLFLHNSPLTFLFWSFFCSDGFLGLSEMKLLRNGCLKMKR